MKVLTEVTKTEVIETEVSLPIYSQKYGSYFRVNEDESVVKIFVPDDSYASITYTTKDKGKPAFNLKDALQADVCSREEVEQATRRALVIMERGISKVNTQKIIQTSKLDESLYRTY